MDPRSQPPDDQGPPSSPFQQVVIWVAAGAAAVVVLLITVMLVMGDRGQAAGGEPTATPSASASIQASSTPAATASPSATPSATARPTVTPPQPTPEPKPPATLARGWARITTDLNLREDAATDAPLIDRLAVDDVVWVYGPRQHSNGYDWYSVQTLAKDYGWIASGPSDEPFATALSDEEVYLSCGPVTTDKGIRVKGLRPGPLTGVERGGFELADATGTDGCVTYALEGDEPVAYLQLFEDACGAPVWDGTRLTLKPTAWGDVINDYKVKRTVEVASALFTDRSAVDEAGLTNKLKIFLLGAELTQPFACISVYLKDAEEQEPLHIDVFLGGECLVMTQLTDTDAVLKPASGGPEVSFRRTSTQSFQGITIGQPTNMNVFATTTNVERMWMGGFGKC